jgi:hypothetical protein
MTAGQPKHNANQHLYATARAAHQTSNSAAPLKTASQAHYFEGAAGISWVLLGLDSTLLEQEGKMCTPPNIAAESPCTTAQ